MEPESTTAPPRTTRRNNGIQTSVILGTSGLVAGAILLVAGWYGVSGESVVAKQVPYLASATAPGIALVLVGTILLAPVLRGAADGADLTERLVELLTEPDDGTAPTSSAPAPPADEHRLLAVAGGSSYHRPTCALVRGKPDAAPVDREAIEARGLDPCRVCRPDAPGAAPTAS